MQETWVQNLGWKNPLQEAMATLYSCLENHMDRGAWQATALWGHIELDTNERLNNTISKTGTLVPLDSLSSPISKYHEPYLDVNQ